MSEYSEYKRERDDFSTNVSTPEYRNFCKVNELNFHFLEDTEKTQGNSYLISEETKLHWQTVMLFNEFKEKYTIYNNKAITWSLDSSITPSIKEELNLEQLLFEYSSLEKKFEEFKTEKELTEAIILLLSIPLFLFFFPPNLDLGIFFSILFLIWFLTKHFLNQRAKLQEVKKTKRFDKRLSLIKSELDKIQNKYEVGKHN